MSILEKSSWKEFCEEVIRFFRIKRKTLKEQDFVKESPHIENLKKRLNAHLGIDLELVINENRSTMLSVLTKKRAYAKVSIHKMFLDAPENVISAVAHYVRGTRTNRSEKDLLIRGYIQKNLSKFNYAHLLDKNKFVTLGRIYDLQEIYQELNDTYFDGSLDLAITWYGVHGKRGRSRITFGQYFDHLRLIKIHRILDDPFFPDFYVKFVIYHEMLHHIVPGHIDQKGLFRVHGHDFKNREKLFGDYERATEWEKRNRKHFFGK